MGPTARDQPNENTDNFPSILSQAELGSPERSPLPPIISFADWMNPTARQQERLAQIRDDVTSSIKRQIIKPVKIEAGSGITQFNKLSDTNWVNWCEDIIWMLNFLKVKDYLLGKIPRPDPDDDPDGGKAWDHNDSYTLHLISLNLSESQKIHISQKNNVK